MSAKLRNVLPAVVGGTSRIMAIAAGLLLVAMVTIICAGVVSRYFLNRPILGINEIVQMNAVALAMLALPYVTFRRGHVRADIFDKFIKRVGRFAGDLITRLLSIATLGFLVKRAWGNTVDAYQFGDATNMLAIPAWPFIALVVLGAAITIVVFLAEIIEIIQKIGPLDE